MPARGFRFFFIGGSAGRGLSCFAEALYMPGGVRPVLRLAVRRVASHSSTSSSLLPCEPFASVARQPLPASHLRRPFRMRPHPSVHSASVARQPLPGLHFRSLFRMRPHPSVHSVPPSARQPLPASHFRRPFRMRPHPSVHSVPSLATRQPLPASHLRRPFRMRPHPRLHAASVGRQPLPGPHFPRPRFRFVHPGTLHCRYCLDNGIESGARAGPGGFGIFGISTASAPSAQGCAALALSRASARPASAPRLR